MTTLFGGVYEGKKVFLTGHTGFKGSWLSLWLAELGARVTGYALPPPTEPAMFDAARVAESLRHIVGDIRDASRLREALAEAEPDVVFHLAAQPLVRRSYEEPLETLETNVLGTANLLEAVRLYASSSRPCAVVIITSDKCYENKEWVYGYREDDPMGGHDPYSMSKGAAELVVSAWRRSFFPAERIACHGVRVASARAGNVIGGGDWRQDRIMTDCIAALRKGVPIRVRNPRATRPWQHVLDPLGAYLLLGAALMDPDPCRASRFAEAWNFGPPGENVWTVARLADEVVRCWGGGGWEEVPGEGGPHEARFLALCCDKARHRLGWSPCWPLPRAVERTIVWFKVHNDGCNMREFTLAQIREYVDDAVSTGAAWIRSFPVGTAP